MKRDLPSWYADALVSRSKLIIAVVLVISAVVGAGAVFGTSGERGIGQAGIDSPAQDALEKIEATYKTDETVVTQVVVRNEGGNTLTRESLLKSLRLQQQLYANESINATLREQTGIVGIENVVATFAYAQDTVPNVGASSPTETNGSAKSAGQPVSPTLDQQISALKSLSNEEFDTLLQRLLDPSTSVMGGNLYQFLPAGYEPGTTHAEARITIVFQADESSPNEVPQEAYEAQVAIASIVEERFDDAFVFGPGIIDHLSSQAVVDSFLVIAPIAIVLLLVVLAVAYRDLLNVLISVFGIAVVMVWYVGIQGWLGISQSSILIAIPFLLIGLSLDYSLHVVMRYREAREGELADDESVRSRDPTSAMRVGVSGVVVALAAAAFTTAIGFLSNYASPLESIQDFAILSGAGIVAMFVVFAALVPAVKIELERLFDRLGWKRRKSAFGVGSGPLHRVLSGIATVSRRVPIVVIVISLLVASVGVYGATDIDTGFNRADFLPTDAPDWMESLPEPFAPHDYDIRANFAYLSENFHQRGQGSQAQILIRGNVTDPALLTAIDAAAHEVNQNEEIAIQPDGTAAIESPVSVLRTVAAENERIAAAIDARDTDGDGLPDRDVAAVYGLLFEVAPDRASAVLHRSANGSCASARLVVGVQANASAQSIADDVRGVASTIEENTQVRAIATGGSVITAIVQSALFETLATGFAITLGVILVFLMGLYWWRYRAPGLGVVMLIPVLIALAWLLGTMSVLNIAFNSETVVITSLAIGLGVDYSIHLGERFVDERARHDSLKDTLSATLT
jgi:predicted RND superfamily exporter protein